MHTSHHTGQASGGSSLPPLANQMPGVGHIELNLRNIGQLFNTMDPSPFHDKDLDHDAEEFILSWAQEYHHFEPVDLVIHLEEAPQEGHPAALVTDAIHNYFAYRARLNQLEFKRLMKQGQTSLLVGVLFLLACLVAIEFLTPSHPATLTKFISEGLTIAGWVAMWKPMQIYLYDWWPLRQRGRTFDKLRQMPVEVRVHR